MPLSGSASSRPPRITSVRDRRACGGASSRWNSRKAVQQFNGSAFSACAKSPEAVRCSAFSAPSADNLRDENRSMSSGVDLWIREMAVPLGGSASSADYVGARQARVQLPTP